MIAETRRRFIVTIATALAMAACRRDNHPRCAFCGMQIAADSRWAVDAVDDHGGALRFDTPGCLFRYGVAHHTAWQSVQMTEYYAGAGARADGRTLRFALGSDVYGPMGNDLVPLAAEHVATFQQDHHPRGVVGFGDVTAAVLGGL